MKKMMLFLLLLFPAMMMAQSTYDQLQPFGFATMNSRTENVPYNLTGGGAYEYPAVGQYVITASGTGDDTELVKNAIKNNAIVVLDGSNGDFIITGTISLDGLHNKTILGINDACLSTEFKVTSTIKAALDEAGVPSKESRNKNGGLPYVLPNGQEVNEEREYYTRKTMLELTRDDTESYMKSGIFKFSTTCENIIIRNVKFEGPGPIDCGGDDLMFITRNSNHIWVDHCEFIDGMDGNFDINHAADFITISWCKFYYTDHAYDHMNTNLIGHSDTNDAEDSGKLNITFAYNHWGERCLQRMPMARYGKIHVLNNYYTCTGNNGNCINPRKNSEFLIEGNYFDESIRYVFEPNNATAWVWSTEYPNIAEGATSSLYTYDSVTVPYTYRYSTELTAANVPAEVGTYAGAVLYATSTDSPSITTDLNSSYEVDRGDDLTLSIVASPVTSYQWYKDGEAIVGATESSYDVNTSVAGEYEYYCVATNSYATGTQTATSTTATVTVNEAASAYQIKWVFDTGTSGQTATIPGEISSKVKDTEVSIGSNLSYSGTQAMNGSAAGAVSTKIKQNTAGSSDDETHAIMFTMQPKAGVTFYPTSVSFRATRCGTDGGRMVIMWYDSESAAANHTVQLGTSAASKEGEGSTDPRRDNNSTQNWTMYSYDLTSSGKNIPSTTGECGLKIILYNANDKSYAYGDIIIEGMFVGVPDAVTTHNVTLSVADGQSSYGTVSPTGVKVVDEGDDLVITATPNTGYMFEKWVVDGVDVNTNSYTISNIVTDHTAVASFIRMNTITFAEGETERGTAPAVSYVEPNGSFTIPTNNSLYVAGKTLTAWNDGVKDYKSGETISDITSDITLTPVFTTNSFALSEIPETEVAISFTQNGGAPIMNAEGANRPSTMRVAQVHSGGAFIDILLSVDATNGKFNNQANLNSCQINATTLLTLPAVNGMKITLNKEFDTSFIGTSTTGTKASGSTTWTYSGEDGTVTLTINEGNKYPTLMTLVYPNGEKPMPIGLGGFSTFSADANYIVSGATVYKAKMVDSEVVLVEVPGGTVIKAGEGIVLNTPYGNDLTISYTDAAATELEDNNMVGVTENRPYGSPMAPYVIATLSGNTAFHPWTGGALFPVGKAYLEAGVDSNNLNELPIRYEGSTGVRIIETQKENAENGIKKYFKDSILIIESNGVRYNSTGARMK